MSAFFRRAGFTLIEAVVFITLIGVLAAAMTPLFGQVLANLHVVDEMVQERYRQSIPSELMLAVQSKLRSDGCAGIAAASETIDMGDGVEYTRQLDVKGVAVDTPGETLSCLATDYVEEDYKCVIITLTRSGEDPYRGYHFCAK